MVVKWTRAYVSKMTTATESDRKLQLDLHSKRSAGDSMKPSFSKHERIAFWSFPFSSIVKAREKLEEQFVFFELTERSCSLRMHSMCSVMSY